METTKSAKKRIANELEEFLRGRGRRKPFLTHNQTRTIREAIKLLWSENE